MAVQDIAPSPALEQIVPGAALQEIVSIAADQLVRTWTGVEDRIVSGASIEVVATGVAASAGHEVVPLTAELPVVTDDPEEAVITRATEEMIVAAETDQTVRTAATAEEVIAGTPFDHVVAGETVDDIGPRRPVDRVIARCSLDGHRSSGAGPDGLCERGRCPDAQARSDEEQKGQEDAIQRRVAPTPRHSDPLSPERSRISRKRNRNLAVPAISCKAIRVEMRQLDPTGGWPAIQALPRRS